MATEQVGVQFRQINCSYGIGSALRAVSLLSTSLPRLVFASCVRCSAPYALIVDRRIEFYCLILAVSLSTLFSWSATTIHSSAAVCKNGLRCVMLWYGLGRPVITSEIGNWSVFVLLGWRFVFGTIIKRDAREPRIVGCHHDSGNNTADSLLRLLRSKLSNHHGLAK